MKRVEGSSGEGVRAKERDSSLDQAAASGFPASDSKLNTTLEMVFVLNVSDRLTRLGRELMTRDMLEEERRSSARLREVMVDKLAKVLQTWVGFNQYKEERDIFWTGKPFFRNRFSSVSVTLGSPPRLSSFTTRRSWQSRWSLKLHRLRESRLPAERER